MNSNLIFDVVIIGAGPAGSTAALALQDSKLRVALIDKDRFPRDKVCGDAVAAYVPKVLNTINKDLPSKLQKFTDRVPVNSVRIVAPNRIELDYRFHEEGFISTRLSFDNWLFEQAKEVKNVEIFENTRVTKISREDDGYRIESNNEVFQARLLIGADGTNGIVQKQTTAIPVDHRHHAGAVRAYYENVTGIPDKTFELHFIKDILPGYFWIFPLPDNKANVGLGMLSAAVSRKKVNLRKSMEQIIAENPYLKDRFKDAKPISKVQGFGLPLGSRKLPLSGDHFILTGDAASLIDPASGEGIGQAMVSGRYAGWKAKECFEQNRFDSDFLKTYDKQVYDKLWSENYARFILQRIIDRVPWIFNLGMNLASRNKFVNRMVKGLIGHM